MDSLQILLWLIVVALLALLLGVWLRTRQQAEQALRREREKLQLILDHAPIGIWLQDGSGKITFVNKAFCAALGIPEARFLAVPHYVELIPEAFRAQCLASDAKALAHHGISISQQQLPFVDGQVHDLRVIKAVKRDERGEPLALVGLSLDITEELKQQQALRESEIKFHTMLDWTYDWEYWISPEGRIHYMTPSVERITGYLPAAFQTAPDLIDQIVHPDDRLLWDRHKRHYLAGSGSAEVEEFDMRIVHRDGSIVWVIHTCRPLFGADGSSFGRRVTVRDIGARKAAEDQIRTLAYFDPLTGLPNRRLLLDRLGHALIACQRSREYGALMILDLDHFKALNDTRGHDLGDQLLVDVARRLQASVRQVDTVSRLGGDEYVVLLEGLGNDEQAAAKHAEDAAEKVRQSLGQLYRLPGMALEHHSTASIGLTLFGGTASDQERTVDGVLKQADVALYQAKDAGRNVVRFFNPAMQALIDARAAMEDALRRALREGELHLYYQPQVDLHGQLIGAEALLRWLPPDSASVPPASFIPLAEDTGLILPIGQWVLDTACAQLKIWEAYPATAAMILSVNVSARQFLQADFVAQVRASLARSGASPTRLALELTESVLLENVEEAILRMQQLRALGIGFALDDFGTGYSSLSYLKRLPLDQVKIDQSFVRDVNHDPNDAAIVRAILAMSRSLGLGVIAEGVETEAQYAFLSENGCTEFQGYWFGKPLPIEEWNRRWADLPVE